MLGKRHCYYHHQLHLLQRRQCASAARPQFALPSLDDPHAIQFAIAQVMQSILNETISDKKAGLLLYALQTASANLPRMQPPQPEQIIRQDYPQSVPELEQIKRQRAITTDDSLAAYLLNSLGLAEEAIKFDPSLAQAIPEVPTEPNGDHPGTASRE